MNHQGTGIVHKKFELFVVIFVTLIGAFFGTWAGLINRGIYWHISAPTGLVLGITSGFFVSKLYLNLLARVFAGQISRFMAWLISTLVAGVFGVICTTLIHAILMFFYIFVCNDPLGSHWDGLWYIVIIACEIVGATVGLVAGGLCTLIYMSKIIKEKDSPVKKKIENQEVVDEI